MTLAQAPRGVPLKLVDILGGEGVRRRLLALGFHKGDILELDSQGILRGPILVRNITSDTTVALGWGIASKILVEVADGEK